MLPAPGPGVDGAGFGSTQLLARRGRRFRAVLPLWWSERENAFGESAEQWEHACEPSCDAVVQERGGREDEGVSGSDVVSGGKRGKHAGRSCSVDVGGRQFGRTFEQHEPRRSGCGIFECSDVVGMFSSVDTVFEVAVRIHAGDAEQQSGSGFVPFDPGSGIIGCGGAVVEQRGSTGEQQQVGRWGGRRSPVGITFGTVTPEVLHQQQHEEQVAAQMSEGHAQAQLQALQESVEQRRQQESVVFQESPSRQLGHRQQGHPRAVHPSLLHENGGLGVGRHGMMSVMEPVNSGGGMGEEFPYLDIINDLLEDDQGCFGLALSAMLQQPRSAPFTNRHVGLPSHSGMLKHNQYGQLRGDGSNGAYNDGSERGRTSDEERMHMHEGNSASMRDSRRMSVAFSHQPLGRL
jgi:hypothetical protein